MDYVANVIEDYINSEFCNPFDEKPQNFFMKLEHCGRYLYALNNISKKDIVADIACATGYGSDLLTQKAKFVVGADINNFETIKKTRSVIFNEAMQLGRDVFYDDIRWKQHIKSDWEQLIKRMRNRCASKNEIMLAKMIMDRCLSDKGGSRYNSNDGLGK